MRYLLIALIAAGCALHSDIAIEQGEELQMGECPVEGAHFRFIETNGIRMRIAEMGDRGPMVVFAHGFPELWYSWRHQMPSLAAAGFRVVVPEMRGYGRTDAPAPVEAYDIKQLSADMVGILDALGEKTATIVGHDWGAPVAAHSALFYPDRFTSLVLMSVPYWGTYPSSPMQAMRSQYGDRFFYVLYHNEPGGVAEAEHDADPRGFLSRLYLSPDSPREAPLVTDPKRSAGGWIPRLGAPKGLPDWLTKADLDYYVAQFTESDFRGGVNYYRNIERNWLITVDITDRQIKVPTLFLAGERDMVIGGATKDMLEGMMKPAIPQLSDVILLPGIGHWVQQEAPDETNRASLEFLRDL